MKNSIKSIAVYDLDGTIIDSRHRFKKLSDGRIDLGHWYANRHKCCDDKLLPLAKKYKSDLRRRSRAVIIATARELADADMEFIKHKLGMPDFIVSRKTQEEDTQQLKIDGIREILTNYVNARVTIYEDNVKNLLALTHEFNAIGVYVPSEQA